MKKKINQLMAKKEQFTIPNTDIVLNIGGLTFTELTEFAKYSETKDVKGAMNFLLFTTLRKSILKPEKDGENGMSDDEIKSLMDNMDGKFAVEIIKKIQELSGLDVEGGQKK